MTDVQAESTELDFSIDEDNPSEEVQEVEQGDPDSPPEEVVDEQEDGQEAAPAAEAPTESSVMRQMRDELRRKERELRELKAKTAAPPADAPKDPGEMPDIEAFDYDTEAYRAAIHKWNADKLKFEGHRKQQEAEQAKVVERYEAAVQSFRANGAKIHGFDAAVEDVSSVLSMDQQNTLLLKAPDVAHRIVMALHRSPEKLEALARITDPVDYGIELGKLQALAKSAPRKPKPSVKVEREVKGFSGYGKPKDKTEEFLSKVFPDMKIS